MRIQIEEQVQPVADQYSALLAVIRPMLQALLYSARGSVIQQAGGYDKVSLEMLTFLRQPHDGELGICFEYAVHNAIRNGDPMVLERISDSLRMCRVRGSHPDSILFGAEKTGSQQIIDTAASILTPRSQLLYGRAGRPVVLKDYIHEVAEAFRKEDARARLPASIRGLWKADLFVGTTDEDYWVGATVKINPSRLSGADGLRIGVVPLASGESDRPYWDEAKNLVVCPIKHDRDFMEVFYIAWRILAQVMEAKGKMPKDVAIPEGLHRQIARELVDRMQFPVLEVVATLGAQAQPGLLNTVQQDVSVEERGSGAAEVTSVVAPVAREIE